MYLLCFLQKAPSGKETKSETTSSRGIKRKASSGSDIDLPAKRQRGSDEEILSGSEEQSDHSQSASELGSDSEGDFPDFFPELPAGHRLLDLIEKRARELAAERSQDSKSSK